MDAERLSRQIAVSMDPGFRRDDGMGRDYAGLAPIRV